MHEQRAQCVCRPHAQHRIFSCRLKGSFCVVVQRLKLHLLDRTETGYKPVSLADRLNRNGLTIQYNFGTTLSGVFENLILLSSPVCATGPAKVNPLDFVREYQTRPNAIAPATDRTLIRTAPSFPLWMIHSPLVAFRKNMEKYPAVHTARLRVLRSTTGRSG